MQKVSKAYKESMKASLRERGFIMISFGILNQKIQANARVKDGDFAHYSNTESIFKEKVDDLVYATLEENFTRVDGSMFFLPRRSASSAYLDTGIVSRELVSDKKFELTIALNVLAQDFKGITINFGENYPVDFDMVGDTGQVIEFRGNDKGLFTTEEVLENTTTVKFIFYRIKNPQSRVRIYSIRFGYGLVYHNDEVMASKLDTYVSPIGADVPQVDFSVTLKNYDKYFNVDNPKSAINFLETGQEMDIYYGYELPETGEIEWVRGNHLLCSEWESDDFTATIRCQDVLRSMDAEYYKGRYEPNGISYFDLAKEIIVDAGKKKFYIDPRLKKLYTKNPIPRVKHKEALQIIANASRCVLSQTRDGRIQIKSNFAPEAEAYSSDGTNYSNIKAILDGRPKEEYASLNTNYTVVDGTMFFYPRRGQTTIHTGFVSAALSGEDCTFSKNPKIKVVQEAQCMYHGVKLTFGHALPGAFTIRTYNNNELVEEFENEDEIVKNMSILHDFDDFDTMEIEFTKTKEPFNRIVLNNFEFGDITDFTITRKDMTSSPKAIKQELIKEVVVPCYSYMKGVQEENLVSEEVTVKSGETQTFFVGEASHDFRAAIEGVENGVKVIDSGCYYATVKFFVTGKHKLELYGYRYKVVERQVVKSLNNRGKVIKWENPVISDMEIAHDLVEWLGEYYKSGIEYEYDTRGNPELDVNDIVYQENDFIDDMKVTVYRQTLEFNQSFSGRITARRKGV